MHTHCVRSYVVVATTLVLLTTSAVFGQCFEWTEATPGNFSSAADAYDESRGLPLSFGGRVGGSTISDTTRVWNGSQWVSLDPQIRPMRRLSAAMAFDGVTGRMLLFGGSESPTDSQTWAWDGTTWSVAADGGPEERYGHTMQYDPIRQQVILFGGYGHVSRKTLSDTWSWNGQAWELLSTTGPPARDYHVMAWDEASGRLVMFGGRSGVGGTRLGDTWLWDGTRWTQAAGEMPEARSEAGMSEAGPVHNVILMGGSTATTSDARDVWSWSGSGWTKLADCPLGPRSGHTLLWDRVRSALLLYGGSSGDYPNFRPTVWRFKDNSWTVADDNAPFSWSKGQMVYDSVRDQVVLVQAGNIYIGERVETWSWRDGRWSQLDGNGPTFRYNFHAAYDVPRDKIVYYAAAGENLRETWEWDGAAWTLASSNGPVTGVLGLVFDERLQRIVAYSRDSQVPQLWSWNGAGWDLVWQGSTGSMGSAGDVRLAFNRSSDRLTLIGSRVWEWDGTRWTDFGPAAPGDRKYQAVAYDSSRHVIALFGGWRLTNQQKGDYWTWDGSTWSLINDDDNMKQEGSSMVFDERRGRMVRFGGTDSMYQTWEVVQDPTISMHPADLDIVEGADAEFSVTAFSESPMTFAWRKDGQLLDDNERIHGADSPVLIVAECRLSDIGTYEAMVTTSCGTAYSHTAELTVRSAIALQVTPTCPGGGPISVNWSGATPGGQIVLIYARNTGSFVIPAGNPCAGTALGLGASQIQVAYQGGAGANGSRNVNSNAAPGACGGYLQLLDASTCQVSNVAQIN